MISIIMSFHRYRVCLFFVALLFIAGCSEEAPLSQTTVEFEGVQFPVPKGWTNVKPEQEKTKVMLVRRRDTKQGDGTAKSVNAVIMVDVGLPASPNLPSAETVAKAQGGINPQDFLLDGDNAIRFEMPSENLSKPRYLSSVYHKGKGYLIMGSAAKGADVAPTFDEVLKTWKWK
jgi:hypothetical protein